MTIMSLPVDIREAIFKRVCVTCALEVCDSEAGRRLAAGTAILHALEHGTRLLSTCRAFRADELLSSHLRGLVHGFVDVRVLEIKGLSEDPQLLKVVEQAPNGRVVSWTLARQFGKIRQLPGFIWAMNGPFAARCRVLSESTVA